ncbi:hypothetical protein Tco_0148121, partial [Tanacetum coccineum]
MTALVHLTAMELLMDVVVVDLLVVVVVEIKEDVDVVVKSRPTGPSTGPSAGILGPRPSQAYATSIAPSTLAYALELESAMHRMTLNPPDKNWYMDTRASSHMT